MKTIIANSIEEVLSILNSNSENNFDFENPENPNESQIIEYDVNDDIDPIYWSWEKSNNNFNLYC